MALRAKGTPEAISEVVAALGDEDERIRWLAGSVLQSIGGETVIATLKAFVEKTESEVGREEAERVLGKLTEGR
jgi:HEAT repeat protein